MKKFICKYCNKEFNSIIGLNNHLRKHKEYYLDRDGNLDGYFHYHQVVRERWDKENKLKEQEKQNELEQWISEKHKCKICGKIMTTKFGSGDYCSNKCAHVRIFSEETKAKIGSTVKDTFRKNHPEKDFSSRYCTICGKEININNKSGYCKECIRSAPELKEFRSSISKNASKHVKNHNTWISRDKLSYAERFWIEVLNNNNIKYEHNYSVKNDRNTIYFLDFYIEKNGYKIDLEIDGRQHEDEDRKEHDKIRDEFLTKSNYIVYRIKWNSINKKMGSDEMKDKIDTFLDFYNNL